VFIFLNDKVIDDEKRLKQLEMKKKAKKKGGESLTSALDVPFPDPNGIKKKKRSKIRTYNIKKDDLDEDRTLLEQGGFCGLIPLQIRCFISSINVLHFAKYVITLFSLKAI